MKQSRRLVLPLLGILAIFLVLLGCMQPVGGSGGSGDSNDTEEAGDGTTDDQESTTDDDSAQGSTYSLSFDANGGTGSIASLALAEGETTTLPTTGFTRSGWNFDGWEDGAGTAFAAGATFTMPAANVTLYAQWASASFYHASFTLGASGSTIRIGAIALGESGELHIAGRFDGTIDFDPGPGIDNGGSESAPNGGLYFARYGSDDSLSWVRTIPSSIGYDPMSMTSPNPNWIRAIEVDSSGNIYVVGDFQEELDFDPGSGEATRSPTPPVDSRDETESDGFILKLDQNGNFVNVATITGSGGETVADVELDDLGNVHIVGSFFSSQVDLDPDPTDTDMRSRVGSQNDIFAVKLDANLDYLWGYNGGTDGSDRGTGIGVLSNGGVVVTGDLGGDGSVDFDPDTATENISFAGSSDILLLRLSSDGGFSGVSAVGGTNADNATGLTVDGDNHLYITGSYSGSVDFDPSPGTDTLHAGSGSDMFLSSYDSSGGYRWSQTVSGTDNTYGEGVALGPAGDVYVVGFIRQTVDFDPDQDVTKNLVSQGFDDPFLARYSADGAFVDAWSMGSGQEARAYQVASGGNGVISVAGYYRAEIDLDPRPDQEDSYPSLGSTDSFVVRIAPDGSL